MSNQCTIRCTWHGIEVLLWFFFFLHTVLRGIFGSGASDVAATPISQDCRLAATCKGMGIMNHIIGLGLMCTNKVRAFQSAAQNTGSSRQSSCESCTEILIKTCMRKLPLGARMDH